MTARAQVVALPVALRARNSPISRGVRSQVRPSPNVDVLEAVIVATRRDAVAVRVTKALGDVCGDWTSSRRVFRLISFEG
jgi:hypothetical protein